MDNVKTAEKLEIGLPKKFKFILCDVGGNIQRPGKGDMIKYLLKKVCNLDTLYALNAERELSKNGSVTIGIYPRQIAQTMKNRADEVLAEPQHKIFGVITKIEPED